MVSVLPVSPWREERLRQVSHVSLTDRGFTRLLDNLVSFDIEQLVSRDTEWLTVLHEHDHLILSAIEAISGSEVGHRYRLRIQRMKQPGHRSRKSHVFPAAVAMLGGSARAERE
jgi:hypothetical protein